MPEFCGVDGLQGARFEIRTTDPVDLDSERLERTAKLVLDVEQFAFELPATGQENAQALAILICDVHLAEPSDAHHMCDAARIVSVRFIVLSRQGLLHGDRLDDDHRSPIADSSL